MKNLVNLILSLMSLFAVTSAYASTGGSHGAGHTPPSIDTLLWPAVNFTLYLFCMIYFFKKLAKPILKDYRIELEGSVTKQQNEKNMLQSEYDQLSEKLSNISEEKQEIVSELEKDGRDLANTILSAANQQAEKVSLSSKRRYELEAQKVSGEVKKTLMNKVVSKVKSQIATSFSADDDLKFIKSSIQADLSKIFVEK